MPRHLPENPENVATGRIVRCVVAFEGLATAVPRDDARGMGVYNFPDAIQSWGGELRRMKPDALRALGTPENRGASEGADAVLGNLPVAGQR